MATNLMIWLDAANGLDSNDGLTEATPWQTLNKLLSTVFTTNVTIGIKTGVYYLTSSTSAGESGTLSHLLIGMGQVVIKTNSTYLANIGSSSNGPTWEFRNITFLTTGNLIGPSGYLAQLRFINCAFNSQLCNINNALVGGGAQFINCTTVSGVTIPADSHVDYTHSVIDSATSAYVTLTQFRCNVGSGTLNGGSLFNPSGSFATLTGAYPNFPIGIASANNIKIYPPTVSSNTVKTTNFAGTSGTLAVSPLIDIFKELVSNNAEYESSTSGVRFNIDYGTAITATGIYCANGYAGGAVNNGVQNFVLEGSNSATAFSDTTYADETNWTVLASGTFNVRGSDQTVRNPQLIPFANSWAYRYYSIKLLNNFNNNSTMFMNKLLVAAANTFTRPDNDLLCMGSTGSLYFFPSSTGWANDPTFTSGTAAITDSGISIASGTSIQVISPVMQYASNVTIEAVACSATDVPSSTVFWARGSSSYFLPLDSTPPWISINQNADNVNVSGTFMQYKIRGTP